MHGMYVGKFLPATIDADYELLKWLNHISKTCSINYKQHREIAVRTIGKWLNHMYQSAQGNEIFKFF